MQQHENRPENESTVGSVKSIIRLVNFIIDTLIWLILYFLVAFILDLYLVRFNSYLTNYIYSISLGVILFVAYYALFEFYFHKTLGKLIKGTRVVDSDGREIMFSTNFKRTIARLIPIDIFYYLFSKQGLHDRLSGTQVITSKTNPA